MLRVRLAVKINCLWISQLTRRYGGVTLLQCIPGATQTGVSALAKVRASGNKNEIEETVKQVRSIEEASFTEINNGVFLGIVRTSSCPCANTVLPHYNFVRAISESDGFLRWALLMSNGRSLSRLTTQLQKRNFEYKIEEVSKENARSPLTAKQEQILNMALTLGFYNVPRRIGLDGLSQGRRKFINFSESANSLTGIGCGLKVTCRFPPERLSVETLLPPPEVSDMTRSSSICQAILLIGVLIFSVFAIQFPLAYAPPPSPSLNVQSVSISSPAGAVDKMISTGQTFVVNAKIKASEDSPSVTATISLPSGYSLTGGSTASQTQTVGSTSPTDFFWNVLAPSSATVSADITVSATASGFTGDSKSFSVTTVVAATLGGTLSASPTSVNLGDTITVTMTVTNGGTASASIVAPSSLTLSGTGSATLSSGPTPSSATIAGGNSQTFTWTYSAASAGSIQFSGSASGTDENSGYTVGTGTLTSNTVTIVKPNSPPTISSFTASPPNPAVVGTTVTLTVVATDADGDSLEYRFSTDGGTSWSSWSPSNTFNWVTVVADKGTHTLLAQVRDTYDYNPVTSGPLTYQLIYGFGGFLPPLGSGNFKAGSTIPVKFQLTDAGGNYISTAVARTWVDSLTTPGTSSGSSNDGNYFRYDATSNQYIFNLSTKGMSAGTHTIYVTLDDGTTHQTTITLK